jgi:uncharacterized membrane protein YphA (DoxX/SURF4 family)
VIAPLAQLGSAWRRFWFEPQQSSTLALVRIAFGLLVVLWTLSLIPTLSDFFGPDGVAPGSFEDFSGDWGLLPNPAGTPILVLLTIALLLGSVALTVGLFTRVAAIVVFVGVLSIEHANTLIGNSGDGLIRNLAFYLMLAPSGTALSLDRLRRSREDFWSFPMIAPWVLRLIQIQLSVGYLSAVWHKVQSDLWRSGTAVSYAMRLEDIHRFPFPGFITQSTMLTEALTFGTLVLELSLGILVWNRAARPWVMTFGASMHLAIDYTILIGFFSLAMFVCYLAFLRAETATRLILATRDRVTARIRRRVPHRVPEPAPEANPTLT